LPDVLQNACASAEVHLHGLSFTYISMQRQPAHQDS